MDRKTTLAALALGLSLALACSSDNNEPGGGGLDQALGSEMSQLGDLGDQFIGENQATYDTLDQATELIGAAIEGGLPAPSIATKQAGCLPDELAGQTLLVDVQSNTFTPTTPQGPEGAVQFRLLSDPQTEVGYVNITCTGTLPGPITVGVSVNTSDDAEVLDLTAANISVFPPSSFSAFLTGTLSSTGGDSISFGAFGFEGGSSIGLDEFGNFGSTAFLVGDTLTATVSQTVTTDPSFPFEEIRILVAGTPRFDFEEFVCPNDLLYDGFMTGDPGDVSGGAIFCARPPLADGFNYFVNCFDGSIDNMVVSPATVSCMMGFFEGDPTQVSQGVLNDIQEGTDALLGMHNAVISVAQAGAQVALQLAAAQQQQF